MQKLRCNCCGRDLQAGTLKYVIEIKSFADFDGYLEDFEGDFDEGIGRLLETMEDMDEKTLEEDISKELIFILCKACRDRFVNDPFRTDKTSFKGDDVKGTVH